MVKGNSQRTIAIPGNDEAWLVEDRKRRVVWSTDTTTCVNCDSTIDLDTTHYHVTLRAAATDGEDGTTRELVFCSRTCADEWLRW